MLKLIKLEWKKNNIGKYVRNAIILSAVLCLFMLVLANDPDTEDDISLFIEIISSMSFLVFTGVMLSSFMVSTYKNKTMNLMFSYPIKRQKILISQMLSVWIFNFAALVLTKLLLYGCLLLGSQFIIWPISFDFNMASTGFYIQLIVKSVITVTISFIALFIGMAMKSSKATNVSSFVLLILTQGNIGDLTMANNAIFNVILVTISLFFAFLSIYGVETKDLI